MNSVERVKAICAERKIPIYKLEKDLEFGNGYISQLKKGTFPADRLAKIADYLNLSVEFLLTGEKKEKAPSDSGEGGISEKQLKAAFFRGADPTLTVIVSDKTAIFTHELHTDCTRENRPTQEGKGGVLIPAHGQSAGHRPSPAGRPCRRSSRGLCSWRTSRPAPAAPRVWRSPGPAAARSPDSSGDRTAAAASPEPCRSGGTDLPGAPSLAALACPGGRSIV